MTLAMAAVAIPPAATLTYRVTNLTKRTNEMVTSFSGGDMYRMNRETLHSMGFIEEETVAFLGNPHLIPSRKAAITVAIESLWGTSGLKHIVALGSMIETESGAVRLQRTTELISAYHRGIAPVATVVRWENELFVKDRAGNSIAVLPADRLLWTEQTRNFAAGMRAATHPDLGLAIWTTGVFSDTTRTAMTDRGILFRDKIEHK